MSRYHDASHPSSPSLACTGGFAVRMAVTTCRVSTNALSTTARDAMNGTSTARARASVSRRTVNLEREE